MFIYSSFCLLVKTLFSKVISKAPFFLIPFSVVMSHIYNMFVRLYSIRGSSKILADFFKIHSLSCIVVLVWQMHWVMFLSQYHTDLFHHPWNSLSCLFIVLTPLPTSNFWHLVAFLVLVKTGTQGNLWVWCKLK